LRRLAKLAVKHNDLSTAIDAFRKLSRIETGAAKKAALLELVAACESKGRPAEAIADVEAALADASTDDDVRSAARKLYALVGARRKQARMLIDDASRQSDAVARAAVLLQASELFFSERAWDDALAAANEARMLDPQSAKAVVVASRALAARGERAPAIDALAKFASSRNWRKSKELACVFAEMAEIHLSEDELVEAFDSLREAHRLDKSDTNVCYLLGLVALDLDEVDVASAALRACVATRRAGSASPGGDEASQLSRAYYQLAVIEHAKGDDGAARRMVSRAMEESPSNVDARRLMVELRPASLEN
jgi:tetratricopeptide (TPR) repeat protein